MCIFVKDGYTKDHFFALNKNSAKKNKKSLKEIVVIKNIYSTICLIKWTITWWQRNFGSQNMLSKKVFVLL